jgi:hypothetical protein
MQTGADKNLDYLPGLKNAFQMAGQPGSGSGKAVYALTAGYRDHGNDPAGNPKSVAFPTCCGAWSKQGADKDK